ncbi:MAG TPA: DUF1028 domain-containing protein [Mycobacteriales bacterium]|nr:DUF1028 domain-containing protein [Mycobacteriales bacterium]
MTFSVVGRDGSAGAWGVAVASKFLAVGSAVPAGDPAAGALATQAMANLRYRPDGLSLLRDGGSAAEVVAALTAEDPDRAHRQLGIVDRDGGSGSYTGAECIPWAGHRIGPDYAVQGNCLVGPEVVEEAERGWLGATEAPSLARRLLVALAAGDGAGGDKRGRQSAALLVVAPGAGYGGGSDVAVDLRVDDHPAPVVELERLLGLHELYFGTPDPQDLLALDGEVRDEVAGHLRRCGYADADTDFASAYERWLGTENYEERHVEGQIDRVVLGRLREQAGG